MGDDLVKRIEELVSKLAKAVAGMVPDIEELINIPKKHASLLLAERRIALRDMPYPGDSQ